MPGKCIICGTAEPVSGWAAAESLCNNPACLAEADRVVRERISREEQASLLESWRATEGRTDGDL